MYAHRINPNFVGDIRNPIEVTRPTMCSQHQRVATTLLRQDDCDDALSVFQALALACGIRETTQISSGSAIPEIRDVDDIVRLETWTRTQARNARVAVSRIGLRDVPKRVVDEFAVGGAGGTGVLTGEHGELILEYSNQIRTIAAGWREVESGFADVADQIRIANIGLEGVNIRNDQEIAKLALSSLAGRAELLQSYVGVLASVYSGAQGANPFGVAAATASASVTQSVYARQEKIINQLRALQGNDKANAVASVLAQLSTNSRAAEERIEHALTSIRQAATDARKVALQLNASSAKAQYAAAKGAGADYVTIGDKAVKFPVNTVQNRLYDSTQKRYEEALRRAKYLSYIARLAVEQRLGFRLSGMDTGVGPLDAPAIWADDICTLTGIDYEALREFTIPNDDGTLLLA